MRLSFADARTQYPALKQLTWLNAAASSPGSRSGIEAMQQHLTQTMETGDLHYPAWARFKDTVRARAAAFIGTKDPNDVAFMPSTSFSFHVIAQCLRARGLDEVLVSEAEFPSTTVPLLNAGLTLRAVRRRPDGSTPVADYEAAVRPSTRAVAVSVVQFSSGYRVELEQLAKWCRDHRLALVLNVAQALGQVPFDVEALGADFMAGATHKWLGAAHGFALFYAKKSWLEGPLPMAGWLSVRPDDLWGAFPSSERVGDATGFTARGLTTRHDATAFEVGGMSWVNVYGLNAALDLQEALGTQAILEHNLGLQRVLRGELRARGFAPNAPDAPEVGSGICVVPVEGDPNAAVHALLREAKIMTTARGGGLRISTHFFNTEDDVRHLTEAIDRLGIRPPRA